MKLHEKIRQIRKGLGLTLKDVHEILLNNLGPNEVLSYRTLLRMENGKISKFSNVLKICAALGITLNELLKDTEFEQKLVIRQDQKYNRYYYNDKAFTDVLSTPEINFLASELTLEPTGKTLIEQSPTGQEKFQKWIHVKKGKLTLIIKDETYNLDEGDNISFDSTIPHRLENNTERKCICIVVQNPKHF